MKVPFSLAIGWISILNYGGFGIDCHAVKGSGGVNNVDNGVGT